MAANDQERIVEEFLQGLGGPTADDVRGAFEKYLADDCVWENIGFPTCTGKDEIMAFLGGLVDGFAMQAIKIVVHNIASAGDVVLTERVDDMLRADGSVIGASIPLMGAFEVRDGQIHAWRDYFDGTGLATQLASG